MKKILILDANQRSALATTRSLGKKGFTIFTADDSLKTLSGASKYSTHSIAYPSPQFQTDAFITYIRSIVNEFGIDFIFPMSEITCSVIMKHRDQFQNVIIPVADFEQFDFLSDKYALFNLASTLNLPIPETYFIEKVDDIDMIIDHIQYPVVLKPARSRIFSNNGYINTTVAFAYSLNELKNLVNQHIYFNEYPFMIQSYIEGIGQGLFALYDKGQSVCYFSHKRLKEKPPQGGVSVLSESVEPTQAMLHSANTLLSHVRWNGVAMVEFKVSADGTPYLMEINARFWGSLQLAIDSGVDFPYLLYQIYSGETVKTPVLYKKGVKLRWLFGDLDRLFIIFKDPDLSISKKLKEFISFCKFFQSGMHYEINRFYDFKPFIFETWQYIRVNIFRR